MARELLCAVMRRSMFAVSTEVIAYRMRRTASNQLAGTHGLYNN